MTIVLIIIFVLMTSLQSIIFLSNEEDVNHNGKLEKTLIIVFALVIYNSLNCIPNKIIEISLLLFYGIYLTSLNTFISLRKIGGNIKNSKKIIVKNILTLIFFITCIIFANTMNLV